MSNYSLLAILCPNGLVLRCILQCPRLLIFIVVMVATGVLSLFLPLSFFFTIIPRSCLNVVGSTVHPCGPHNLPMILSWPFPDVWLGSSSADILSSSSSGQLLYISSGLWVFHEVAPVMSRNPITRGAQKKSLNKKNRQPICPSFTVIYLPQQWCIYISTEIFLPCQCGWSPLFCCCSLISHPSWHQGLKDIVGLLHTILLPLAWLKHMWLNTQSHDRGSSPCSFNLHPYFLIGSSFMHN